MKRRTMKGAIGIPMEVLVAIIIAVIIIVVAAVMFGVIPVLTGSQAARANFESCCVPYMLAGWCKEGVSNPYFECTVDESVSSTGKMQISQLASRAGLPVQSCCK